MSDEHIDTIHPLRIRRGPQAHFRMVGGSVKHGVDSRSLPSLKVQNELSSIPTGSSDESGGISLLSKPRDGQRDPSLLTANSLLSFRRHKQELRRSETVQQVLGTDDRRLTQELGWYLLSVEKQVMHELRSFLPTCLRRYHMETEDTIVHSMRGAVFFADISGFTAMTEKLAQKSNGAEKLSASLNKFFTPMIEIITSHNGDVIKFSGDAVLVVFPETGKQSQDVPPCGTLRCTHTPFELACLRASACALEMHATLPYLNIGVDLNLVTHVGIGCGDIALLQVGGMHNRCEYVIVGPTLEQIAIACPLAERGETVLSPHMVEAVRPWCTFGSPLPSGYARLLDLTSHHSLGHIKKAAMCDVRGEKNAHSGLQPVQLVKFIPRSVQQHFRHGAAANVNEMRTVTIVFVQIESTALSRTVTTESAQLAQEIMQAMQQATYGHEGNINKFLVDDKGLLIVAAFGLPPLVHFDDPLRSIASCFMMIDALQDIGVEGARFGITTGRVFCGIIGSERRREYTVMGDTVNLAARLMARTELSTILMDRATYERVKDDVLCDVLEPIQVKGKEDPIDIFRPREPREFKRVQRETGKRHVSQMSSTGKRQTWGRQETALGLTQLPWRAASDVFRGPSLVTSLTSWASRTKLENVFAMTKDGLANGASGGYHFLVGPSGGGKVELCELTIDKAHKNNWALCYAITYGMAGELFRPLVHIVDSLLKVLHARTSLADFVSCYPADRPLLATLGLMRPEDDFTTIDLSQISAPESMEIQERTHDLIKRIIDRISNSRPLLLTLREYVGQSIFIQKQTVFWNLVSFLLNTYTKGTHVGKPVWIQVVAREVQHCDAEHIIECARLSRSETKELAFLSLGPKTSIRNFHYPNELRRFLSEVALNNPCYVQESIKTLLAQNHLVIENSSVGVANWGNIDMVQWAHTRMVGSIRAKLERLPPMQEQVLKIASVFENAFSSFDLQAAAHIVFGRKGGFLTLYDLVKAVMAAESLVQEGLLEEETGESDARRWVLRNFLVRKIAAGSILQEQRMLIKRSVLMHRALQRARMERNTCSTVSAPSFTRILSGTSISNESYRSTFSHVESRSTGPTVMTRDRDMHGTQYTSNRTYKASGSDGMTRDRDVHGTQYTSNGTYKASGSDGTSPTWRVAASVVSDGSQFSLPSSWLSPDHNPSLDFSLNRSTSGSVHRARLNSVRDTHSSASTDVSEPRMVSLPRFTSAVAKVPSRITSETFECTSKASASNVQVAGRSLKTTKTVQFVGTLDESEEET